MPSPRTRSFRRSVVQVVSAFTPLLGAGCDLFEVTEVTRNPPHCEPYPACVPAPECPAELPEARDLCDAPGQACAYETGEAVCVEGQWRVQEAPPESCPDALPEHGEACRVPEELDCDFSCESARCIDGKWQALAVECNPPPMLETECPEALPQDQDGCYYEGPACAYPEGHSAECVDYSWQVSQPLPAACPEQVPVDGEACVALEEACAYGDCYGVPTITADCVESVWQVAERSCNPPPLEPDCSADPDAEGCPEETL